MFNNPFKALAAAIDENQKAAECVIRAIDDHMGIKRPKLPEPFKKVSTDHQSFARPA